MKKLPLSLNKEVIDQLDKNEAGNILGGDAITSIAGSNCNNSNPAQHACCAPPPTQDPGASTSAGTVNKTAMPGTCCCNASVNTTCPPIKVIG